MNVVTLEKKNFQSDTLIHETVHSILRTCYVNPDIALDYSLKECDTLYCAYEKSELTGVFFHRWQPDSLIVNKKEKRVTRMILGAVGEGYKNRGVFKLLLQHIKEDYEKNKYGYYNALYGRT